jgi:uncharacterized membrane protein
MARVLLVGESWSTHSIHTKGFDSFTTSEYAEGAQAWIDVLAGAGHTVDWLRAHEAPHRFPRTAGDLAAWEVVVLSDIGANSLAITTEVWNGGRSPNPLDGLDEWVQAGGGLAMCGGYLSFSGIEAKAAFAGTGVERALPVQISRTDDRVENPTDNVPRTVVPDHPVTRGVGTGWPAVGGYNRVVAKPGADQLVTVGEDPLVVTWTHGRGRALAFTTDIGPHWAPDEFVSSAAYRTLWPAAIEWLAGSSTSADREGTRP